MSENEVTCTKCGKVNRKDSTYCIQCGSSLKDTEKVSVDAEKYRPVSPVSSISSTTPPKIRKKIGTPYKVLIYFVVAIIVNLIFSAIIMGAFSLSGNSYFGIFIGSFLLSLILVAIFWGAGTYGSSHEVGETCGIVIGGIVVAIIAIPLYIFTIFEAIVGSIFAGIGDAINTAINNAISGFFSELFSGIEIPGFEPYLFIGLFLMLSAIVVYRYHLKAKKK